MDLVLISGHGREEFSMRENISSTQEKASDEKEPDLDFEGDFEDPRSPSYVVNSTCDMSLRERLLRRMPQFTMRPAT